MSEANETPTSEPVVSEPTTPATPSTDAAPEQAAAESVKSEFPRTEDDGWSNFGKDVNDSEKAETPAAPETPKPEVDKPEEPAAEEPKEADKDKETADEDDVLEELFQKETDLDALDPEKIIAGQRNKVARAAAERWHKTSQLVRDFENADTPIGDVATKFASRSPKRYEELSTHAAHELVDTYPNETFQRAYVGARLAKDPNWDWKSETLPTLDDIISGPNGTSNVSTAEVSAHADALTEKLGFDWRDPANDDMFLDERELSMAQTARALEAQLKQVPAANTELDALKKQVEQLTGKSETSEQSDLQKAMESEVNDFRASIEDKVIPHIAKFTGLEVTPDDIPEMKAFKEHQMEVLYKGTEYQRKNGLAAPFEAFALNESSVAPDLNKVYERVIAAQVEKAQALLSGDAEKAKACQARVDEERIPIFTLTTKANQEFKKIRIDPIFGLVEKLSSTLTNKINPPGERVEITSSGSDSRSVAPTINHETSEDVWEGMVKRVEQDRALRANA